MKQLDLTLYLVTDSEGFSEEEFLSKIEEALESGVTLLQLREKQREGKDLFHLADKVNKLAQKYNVPLIIDDRADIALAVGAAGVHVGQSDLPVAAARKIMGEDKIVGATAKTVEQALEAQNQGADYLGVGAMYPTTTKVKTVITSPDTLKDICDTVDIPAIAIGGLNSTNLDILKGKGMAGISVVSAIMKSTDVKSTTRELRKAVEEVLG